MHLLGSIFNSSQGNKIIGTVMLPDDKLGVGVEDGIFILDGIINTEIKFIPKP